ncbi:MAG: glycerol-3-phosphate 1-O-acyltransferase PlsY [Elusimicrobia bacterium]|nr:glycerol-3-phosphate 1-O-acyltransferase PlsY [Elusimicrobiota bacterium]
MALILLLLLISFLLGSIPNAYLLAKIFYGIDIRYCGSGNPGATNVWRTVGKIPGTLTFLFDVLKGFMPVFISKKIFTEPSLTIPMLAGFCAVAGHIWTPFLKFKGGKGVATGYGVFLGLAPLSAIFSLIVFSVVLLITKYVALGSITASISLPIFLYFFNEPVITKYVSIILAIIVVWRHKSNIKKILNKTED